MNKTIAMIRRLSREGNMPLRAYTTALLVEGALFPAAQILLSMAQKNLVNALEYSNIQLMNRVYICLALILVLAVLINPVATYCKNYTVQIWVRNMRVHLMDKCLRVPLTFYNEIDGMHSGDILSRMNSDLDTAAGLFSWSLLRLALGLYYGIGSVMALCFLNKPMAAVIIVLAVVQVWIMTRLSLKIREHSAYIQERTGLGGALFLEIVKGLRLIRMFSLSRLLFDKYRHVNQDIWETSLSRNKRILLINTVNDLFVAVNLLGVLSLGLVMYFNNQVDLGSVMAFLILQDGVSYMLGNLTDFFPSVQQAAASATRLFELLDAPVESDATCPAVKTLPPLTGDIVCENVSYTYANREMPALSPVNARFAVGKITVIVGPSGSGKTTLLRILAGLYPADTGTIRYETGASINRASIAYVPQATHLFYDTVAANIRCGVDDGTEHQKTAPTDVVTAAEAASAHSFIMEKPEGYETVIRERGSNYSGGQKQRIAIARAVYRTAAATMASRKTAATLIIWDEATSAIDAENEAVLHNWLRTQADAGKTVIVAAHRPSTLAMADAVVTLYAASSNSNNSLQ